MNPSKQIIEPYGGKLVDLLATGEEAAEIRARASRCPSIQLSDRALCDLQLLATGAFSPLDRFMGQADYRRVLEEMRLSSGHLFPIPITLAVDADGDVAVGRTIALRTSTNVLVGIMDVEEIYSWDRGVEADRVLGTRDSRHPLVAEMFRWGSRYISGPIRVVDLATAADFRELRRTPAETRAVLAGSGRTDVVAFQTRNPLHRVHEELTRRAMDSLDAVLLLHPVVGLTKPGDVDHYTRVRTYKVLAERYYQPGRIVLSLLPLAMRMAGPREALWHALVRRNYGANHFIVGRDHASPGVDSTGRPFYGPYDAQELVRQHQQELGVGFVPFQEFVYLPDEERYEEISKVPRGVRTASLSGTQVRNDFLDKGKPLPSWFTRPEVAAILAESHPRRENRGFCVWFTGLSGAGKSVTAEALTQLLLERGRRVTVLDGDIVRTHLSKGLGFDREGRDANVRRIGFVAAEIVQHGGVAVCAAVSPYLATRAEVRAMFGDEQFIEVYVNTPLEVCEQRDSKGMYAMARRGEIKNFTGIDDPYEAPLAPELFIDAVSTSPLENARSVINFLAALGFIGAERTALERADMLVGAGTV